MFWLTVGYDTWGNTLQGAFALDFVFLAGVLIVIAYVYWRQRSHGEGFTELGWKRPVRIPVMIIAVIYGLAWTAMSYARGGNPWDWSWQHPIMMVIGLVLAFGEEIAVRGLILDRLDRCGTSKFVQILFTGAIMGVYHGIIGFHVSIAFMISSTVLFAILSVIYVYGGRSMMPIFITHAMTHFLGDPDLMQGILYGVQHFG